MYACHAPNQPNPGPGCTCRTYRSADFFFFSETLHAESKGPAWFRVTAVNQRRKQVEPSDSLLGPDPNQQQTLYFCQCVGWPLWPLTYSLYVCEQEPYVFSFLFKACVFCDGRPWETSVTEGPGEVFRGQSSTSTYSHASVIILSPAGTIWKGYFHLLKGVWAGFLLALMEHKKRVWSDGGDTEDSPL